jgi:hypothetical protein
MLNDILEKYKTDDLNLLSEKLKENSPRDGTFNRDPLIDFKMPTDGEWEILTGISNEIWHSTAETEEKFNLGFEFFDRFPSYYQALVPFYHACKNNQFNEDLKPALWEKFSYYLGNDPIYRNPVAYVLWVEFFQDPDMVMDTWHGMQKACEKNGNRHTLLPISGPVPWELKKTFYLEMLKNDAHHELLLKGLIQSATDDCGHIDPTEAKNIFKQLNVNTETEEYRSAEDLFGP